MTILEKTRGLHAVLAVTALAAYATGELGLIHAWIGYAVAAVIALRLVWGLLGPKQVGISRFISVNLFLLCVGLHVAETRC